MVVLDHDTTLQGNRMEDTMAAVKTLLRSRDPEPSMPRFAVRVTQPVDRNTVRNFKALGIQGLIPANTQGNFNFYLKLKAYEEILVRNAEYWPSECIKKNAEPRRGRSQDACGIQLTERQQQVQKLLCERGLSNKAIARHLNISESTVKIHVSAILKRYAVRNRTQLALAVKNHARL
jgi:DNA-binding NarL/FixJ family response regulator